MMAGGTWRVEVVWPEERGERPYVRPSSSPELWSLCLLAYDDSCPNGPIKGTTQTATSTCPSPTEANDGHQHLPVATCSCCDGPANYGIKNYSRSSSAVV